MKVQLQPGSHRTWDITSGRSLIARFNLDYMEQIDEIILYPRIMPSDRERVLQLAASHATQYIVKRRRSCSLDESLAQPASRAESFYVMLSGSVSAQIKTMNAQQLEKELKTLDITIIHAKVDTIAQALDAVVTDSRLANINITFKLGPVNPVTELQEVLFSVQEPSHFCAWHNMGKPTGDNDLYIVPAYHPDRADDKTSQWLLNGDTDALIRGEAVRYVYCPDRGIGPRDLFSSWNKANHPYHAKGSIISVALSPTKVLSQEGIDEVLSVLLSLLEVGGNYFSVSGGFRGPLDLPQNVAMRQCLRTDNWNGEARGSEGICVWAYRVLEREGQLDKAYIPAWFFRERWREAYEADGMPQF